MENLKITVFYKQTAKDAIREIAIYIENKGYPETAEKFAEKFYEFGHSLAVFPNKYPLCRQQRFNTRKMHCAVFHKNFIFVYKQVRTTLIIYNVIHGKALG